MPKEADQKNDITENLGVRIKEAPKETEHVNNITENFGIRIIIKEAPKETGSLDISQDDKN